MSKPKILELFCGTKSIGKEFIKKDFEVTSLDINPIFNADITADILTIPDNFYGKKFDVIWASPPCNAFSVAVIGRNWNYDDTPKNEIAENGLKILEKTFRIILSINPKFFFIENPRGKMRKMRILQTLNRYTITYCQYGFDRQKPTDIFTNVTDLELKPVCKRGQNCHIRSPRGSDTGTQGMSSAIEKAIIPPEFCKYIADYCEVNIK